MARLQNTNKKAQSESAIFWIIFGLILLMIGLWVIYTKYYSSGESVMQVIFGR